jgi:hypothetical protein
VGTAIGPLAGDVVTGRISHQLLHALQISVAKRDPETSSSAQAELDGLAANSARGGHTTWTL